jgi:hypothetical protein
MDLKKDFNIKYTPRKKDSKFILFAELQEDIISVFDDRKVLRFGHEIAKTMLNSTIYFEQYDALYYDNFDLMLKDIQWILEKSNNQIYPFIFHEIENIDEWLSNAKKFERSIKSSLFLLSNPKYKFTYDLIWR